MLTEQCTLKPAAHKCQDWLKNQTYTNQPVHCTSSQLQDNYGEDSGPHTKPGTTCKKQSIHVYSI